MLRRCNSNLLVTVAHTIKISNRALLKLHEALNSLDGSKTGKDEVIPFEFTMDVSWRLSTNAVIVERAKLAFDRALRMVAKQVGLRPGESLHVANNENPDAAKVAKIEKFGQFTELSEELKDKEVDIPGILLIKLEELLNRPSSADGKVLKNPIPQGVRNGLVPIITEGAA